MKKESSLASEISATLQNLPPVRCGRCEHGREIKDVVALRTMIECHEGPPIPILVQTPQGILKRSERPALDPKSSCGRFKLALVNVTARNSAEKPS